MAIVFSGNPLNGTENNDILVDYPNNAADNTLNGLGGNDILLADRDFFYDFAGSSANTAQDITSNTFPWSTYENSEVLNSTTIPYATLVYEATAVGTAWYRVTAGGGSQITLDVDFTGPGLDTVVEIYAADGVTLLASDDDSPRSDGGDGSVSGLDSFLQYTFATTGDYLIRVRQFGGPDFDVGDRFVMHVSLEGQAVTNEQPVSGNDTLNGGLGTDYLSGGGGNDLLVLVEGDDNIGEYFNGGTGTDTIEGSGGSGYDLDFTTSTVVSIEALTYVDPGAGDDGTMRFLASQIGPGLAANATINFSGFSDVTDTLEVQMAGATSLDLSQMTFTGLDDDDDSVRIIGGAAAETIIGSAINDLITGDAGNDILRGGSGNDTLDGGALGDGLFGGLGADAHIGGDGPGVDYARYDDADYGDLVISLVNPGSNTGAAFGDTYTGIEGIIGGVGDDTIAGNGARNYLYGGDGNDLIRGGNGNDFLVGGAGGDGLFGGLGADEHVGGDGVGVDYARYDDQNHGNLVISLVNPGLNTGAAAGDTYIGIEGVIGGVGNDNIAGNGARNFLYGGDGNDSLRGGNGNDFLNGGDDNDNLYGGVGGDQHVGGDGFDYARYDDANYGNLIINLGNSSLNTGAARDDTYSGIEGLVAGAGNDTVTGDGAANTLYGLDGTDKIDGKGGNDTLIGGAGARDDYRFSTALGAGNVDTILGFEDGIDKIVLSRAIFGDVGTTLSASEFGTSGGADVFIIFNQSNGRIFYDAGGNDEGPGQVLFAILGPGRTLDASDFLTIA